MTNTCDVCNGALELVSDNGAEYPQTRVERYECANCGHPDTVVLTP